MWKGPTILMDTIYPFGALPEGTLGTRHLVRKKIAKNDKQLEKARLLAGLKHDCLIKLENAQEQKGEYYLLFQYIHTPLEKWYMSVTREFIENYEQRLILFSRYLSDRGIFTSFKRELMGVSEAGDAKYFLGLDFEIDASMDKMQLKKKYKEQIKAQIQFFIDKKAASKNLAQSKMMMIPEKKENSKILKILEAIEKGKANLCSETPKQQSQALVPQHSILADTKATIKPIKNIQNVIIQKEISKVNKIHMMVNNKPVETLQHEFKREYASSSFYINGLPTVVLEREGETKRLLSPNDKFARFEEIKVKEYKSMKTSGEMYMEDFINVLEDSEKINSPGSPRATIRGPPKIAINQSPRSTFHGSPPKQLPSSPPRLAIEAEPKPQKQELFRPPELKVSPDSKQSPNKVEMKSKQLIESSFKKATSPRGDKNNQLFLSDKGIRPPPIQNNPAIKNSCEIRGPGFNKTNELQKKVSQAIANSLSAISKFKSAKGQVPS